MLWPIFSHAYYLYREKLYEKIEQRVVLFIFVPLCIFQANIFKTEGRESLEEFSFFGENSAKIGNIANV